MTPLSNEAQERLDAAQNIWIASVRPDGRPHLTPVWFAWAGGKLYVSIDPDSVKSKNIAHDPRVALSLEDGLHPVICEGTAAPLEPPWPEEVLAVFLRKYAWDITQENQYHQVVEVTPKKWLAW
jgi:PPOX class probable F420-dependent enzyme